MRRWSIVTIIISLCLVLAQASDLANDAVPRRQVVFGVDISSSITRSQRARWLSLALQVLGSLRPGDSFQLFGIHENTMLAGPVFDRPIPIAPDPGSATVDELLLFKKAYKDFKAGSAAAVNQCITGNTQSLKTDLFSLFDRVKPNGKQKVVMVLFTDGLHSGKDLNLEKVRLRTNEIPRCVRTVTTQHHWTAGTLPGVRVHVILPSIQSGESSPQLNDRPILGEFFDKLLKEIGATLVTFDTHLAQGGSL